MSDETMPPDTSEPAAAAPDPAAILRSKNFVARLILALGSLIIVGVTVAYLATLGLEGRLGVPPAQPAATPPAASVGDAAPS